MSTPIPIANPVPGGARYTSPKRALQMIRRGEAVLTDDGQLFFRRSAEELEQREAERLDAEIKRYRGGVCYWNGDADPLGLHRPGEVVC